MPELVCEHCHTPIAIVATSQHMSYGMMAINLCTSCMRFHDKMLENDGIIERFHENRILTERLGQAAELFDADGHEVTSDRAVANAKQIRIDMRAILAAWEPEPLPEADAK